MQSNIHPKYGPVIFLDTSCDTKLLLPSTYTGTEKMVWEDGNEYPVCRIDISSASHPFYTGGERIESAQGRIAKFRERYARGKKAAPKANADETTNSGDDAK